VKQCGVARRIFQTFLGSIKSRGGDVGSIDAGPDQADDLLAISGFAGASRGEYDPCALNGALHKCSEITTLRRFRHAITLNHGSGGAADAPAAAPQIVASPSRSDHGRCRYRTGVSWPPSSPSPIHNSQDVHWCSMAKRISSSEPQGRPYKTTGLHLPVDLWELLNRVAFERARTKGGRASVSALLVQMIEKNRKALELELGKTVR